MRVTATATRASNTARRASAASRATLSRQDERARRAGLPCHGKTSERGEQGYLVTARRASAASRATLSRQDERARRAGLPCHGKTSERGEQGYLVTARRASAASRATLVTLSGVVPVFAELPGCGGAARNPMRWTLWTIS